MRAGSRIWMWFWGVALVVGAGCRHVPFALWQPTPAGPEEYAVETLTEVSYDVEPGDGHTRRRLDLYLPKNKRDCPVVVLVHGGAWIVGDSRCLGLYSSVAELLARQGIGVVVPNYRLSPGVKHPEHVRDLARAVAWTKTEFGGRPGEKPFLLGHSAGGHLVTLLATDESYLKAEGLSARDLSGVIAVSGVYEIPPGEFDVRLGGDKPRSFRWSSVLPLRGESDAKRAQVASVPLRLNVFGPAFGDDPAVRAQASPIAHVQPGRPPMLLLCAEHDLPSLPEMADGFHRELLRHGNDARLEVMPRRNHNSILFSAIRRDDPVAASIVDFVRSKSESRPSASDSARARLHAP